MITVALTGGIGCGKTTVSRLFSSYNVPVIDTDIIARDLVRAGEPALDEITEYFGNDVLQPDGSLDRKALAHKTFSDSARRKQLESILHPKIRQCINEQLQNLSADYVIIAIPLLFETSQENAYDRVLVVDCDENQQIERTLNRDKRSLQEIKAIIEAQVPRNKRLNSADDIIENNLDMTDLESQVEKLHKNYIKLANSPSQ